MLSPKKYFFHYFKSPQVLPIETETTKGTDSFPTKKSGGIMFSSDDFIILATSFS